MNDKTLVQRLRDSFVYDQRHYAADPLIEEAANTIEALQSDLSRQMAIATEYVNKSEALQSRIEALEAALRDMVDEYVCNVDSYRTGGFYSDPRKDDCVINAEAALESKP